MLRTIACWSVYRPSTKRIVSGFRTRKELRNHFPRGIPIGTVLVRMKGHYHRIGGKNVSAR